MPMKYNGYAIRALRRKSHLTQAVVASAAGISQPHVANVEAGRDDLEDETAQLIAAVLGLEDLRAIQRDPGTDPIPIVPGEVD